MFKNIFFILEVESHIFNSYTNHLVLDMSMRVVQL